MLLLFLLPSLALASINVTMNGYIYYRDNKFTVYGYEEQKGFEEQVITNDDITTLSISIEQLKDMIQKVYGKKPDNVLLRSDMNSGVIYKQHNWDEVQRKIEPAVNDYHMSFKQENVVLTNTNYTNQNDEKKTVQVTESKTVNNCVMSIWTRPMVKGNNVKVKFDFKIKNDDHFYKKVFEKDFVIGDDLRFFVEESFVQNHTIELQPNQSVKARLEATKGTITAGIPYKVKLSGDVIGIFNSTSRNRLIHQFDINYLLEETNRSSTITVYQTVLFEFHYNVKLHIIDANEVIIRTFAEEHATGKNDAGIRKATAKIDSFESSDGVYLLKQSIPAEFNELLHKAVLKETVEENKESDETA